MRIGVVGCGAIARRAHIPGLIAAGAEIAVCTSRTRASAEGAAAEAGGAEVVDDWRELLERTDVDAVSICTPNALHAEAAVQAAQTGKHVLVEKPTAVTVAEVDDMIAAASGAGVVLMPTHNLRYAAPFVAARDAVARGVIGEVVSVRAAFGHGGPQHWAPDSTWFRDEALSGGGVVVDLGVHLADLLHFVTGQRVTSVAADVRSTDGTVEDDAHATIAFEGGALGNFHTSWIANPAPDHQLTIVGAGGTLHLDSRTALTRLPKDVVELPEVTANPFTDFVAAVEGRQVSDIAPSANDGRAAVAVCQAIYESARTGRRVNVQQ